VCYTYGKELDVKFKVGDRVMAHPSWAYKESPATIVRIPGKSGSVSVRLDYYEDKYRSDDDAHSMSFSEIRHITKLERILSGELDTPQQNE
jgi:hypothetical protein